MFVFFIGTYSITPNQSALDQNAQETYQKHVSTYRKYNILSRIYTFDGVVF